MSIYVPFATATKSCWSRLLGQEELERRLCRSAVAFAEHEVDADGWESLFSGDLDGDGDPDILAASSIRGGNIAWYENVNGNGSFGPQRVIATAAAGAGSVYASDVDGDGDLDVVSLIAWYENTDGAGKFGEAKVIVPLRGFDTGPSSAHPSDLDKDGDIDLLVGNDECCNPSVTWYENIDGNGTFREGKQITTERSGGELRSVYAADVDSDGDTDVLSASSRAFSFGEGTIAWYEHIDGRGNFAPMTVISATALYPPSVRAADLDQDGDLDVLSGITWFENTDGMGTFGEGRVIDAARRGTSLPADIDSDGDTDILSSLVVPSQVPFQHEISELAWFQNIDGEGTFGDKLIISLSENLGGPVHVIDAIDVDGDGDVDVLTAPRSKVIWYEQLPQFAPGDSTRDGVFNQLDIVQVLQTAKYHTGQPATFNEGDWNEDGLFDQLDIVAALQTGNYLKGAGLFFD